MICPHCATNNRDGNAFCTECGWKLIRPVEPAMEKTPEAPKLTFESPWKEKEEKENSAQTNGTAQETQGSYESTVIPNDNEPTRMVGFVEAVVSYFKNYVNFKDRATRGEYWFVVLFAFIVSAVLSLIGTLFGSVVSDGLNTIWLLATLLPSLGLCWRRMHDIGKSGLFTLLLLIPLVGLVIVLVFFCQPSVGDNEYGPRKTESNRDRC